MISNAFEIFANQPLLPVVRLSKAEQGVPLALALLDGGIGVMEVTLRTNAALAAVDKITANVEISVGLGTVIEADHFRYAHQVGAQFASSPGLNTDLISVAEEEKLPYLPGVFTASEVMLARDLDCNTLKFFPAYTGNRLNHYMQLALAFPSLHFVLTGGVNGENYLDTLNLLGVASVGGSWIAPEELIQAEDWTQITERAKLALAHLPNDREHAAA